MQTVTQTVSFKPDTTTVLRNPAMGWGLYADIVWKHPAPDEWWKGLEPGIPKANFFYYRCRWSTLEPEEGKYAWEHNEQFKKMLEYAKKNNLKLAFRVIARSQDNAEQATPEFVRKAGAEWTVCKTNENFWEPYEDDPVFQQKFSNFIRAFGKRFDNPQEVDFVDGNGLGLWGEQHNLILKNDSQENKDKVLEWICSSYASSFKRVLLAYCFGSAFGLESELRIAVKKYGYIPRRDGLGSEWFTQPQKDFINEHFPEFPLIGEACYWSLEWYKPEQFPLDRIRKLKNVREVLVASIDDAIAGHSNTFDLRNPSDLKIWLRDGQDLIDKFVAEGGYRLLPLKIEYPKEIIAGEKNAYKHCWTNVGCGVCPNANPRWNKKYQVAFALFSDKKEPVSIVADSTAEPSGWIKDVDTDYTSSIAWNVPAGTYHLAVGIVDTTQDNKIGIRCAVADTKRTDGWIDAGLITVK
ncbi:MAG: hypothetical protein LBN39_11015, partial [Planctomycetaceae bacterium]|nr:hypothetical protein [Planctomycetaceae bacterium]